jgi:hypothetical protein
MAAPSMPPARSWIERFPALQGFGRSGVGFLQDRIPIPQGIDRYLLAGYGAQHMPTGPQHGIFAVAIVKHGYVGILVGPAVGGAMLIVLGPAHGILLNAAYYLPLVIWLWKAPYGPAFRVVTKPAKRAVRGLADITQTMRDIAHLPVIVSMTLLGGVASFFIGNGYQAQMPGFAHDLGHGDPGIAYSMLLAADAAGALMAGVMLESTRWLRASPMKAIGLALTWCCVLVAFSFASAYPLALALLFMAGFFELSFSSMAQALVQINAPTDMRGRVIGLFNMSALGLRAFSGVTVGVVGAAVGIHHSLAASATLLFLVVAGIGYFMKHHFAPAAPTALASSVEAGKAR